MLATMGKIVLLHDETAGHRGRVHIAPEEINAGSCRGCKGISNCRGAGHCLPLENRRRRRAGIGIKREVMWNCVLIIKIDGDICSRRNSDGVFIKCHVLRGKNDRYRRAAGSS